MLWKFHKDLIIRKWTQNKTNKPKSFDLKKREWMNHILMFTFKALF